MPESKRILLLEATPETNITINLRTEVCKRVQVHPSALLIAETEANSAPGHLSTDVRVDACGLGHPSHPSH